MKKNHTNVRGISLIIAILASFLMLGTLAISASDVGNIHEETYVEKILWVHIDDFLYEENGVGAIIESENGYAIREIEDGTPIKIYDDVHYLENKLEHLEATMQLPMRNSKLIMSDDEGKSAFSVKLKADKQLIRISDSKLATRLKVVQKVDRNHYYESYIVANAVMETLDDGKVVYGLQVEEPEINPNPMLPEEQETEEKSEDDGIADDLIKPEEEPKTNPNPMLPEEQEPEETPEDDGIADDLIKPEEEPKTNPNPMLPEEQEPEVQPKNNPNPMLPKIEEKVEEDVDENTSSSSPNTMGSENPTQQSSSTDPMASEDSTKSQSEIVIGSGIAGDM